MLRSPTGKPVKQVGRSIKGGSRRIVRTEASSQLLSCFYSVVSFMHSRLHLRTSHDGLTTIPPAPVIGRWSRVSRQSSTKLPLIPSLQHSLSIG